MTILTENHKIDQDPLNRKKYFELKNNLLFNPRYLISLIVLIGDFLLFISAIYLQTIGCPFLFCLSQIILVLVFFHSFSILHDCGHGSCSKNKTINTLTGFYTGIFCFMPFFPWKYIHSQHHSFAGNLEKDPTLKLVKSFEESANIKNFFLRWTWKLWIPVGALMQHIVLWAYPLSMFKQKKLSFIKLSKCIISILIPITTYFGFYLLFPQTFNFTNFGFAILFYLITVELINFPHHLDTDLIRNDEEIERLPLWKQQRVTRSCYFPIGISELLVLNFNFHTEHHLFPTLPWYRLRKARNLVKEALGNDYRESNGVSWSLEKRKKDPVEELKQMKELQKTSYGETKCPFL